VTSMSAAVAYEKTLKPRAVETPLDLFFFRPVAHLFVRAALPTRLSANGMTVIGILVGLAGAALFVYPDRAHTVAACALTMLYAVLDCADGQLARARGTSSRLGRILDGSSDYVVGAASGVAIAIRLHAAGGAVGAWLAVGGLSSVVLQGTLFDYFKNRYLALSQASYREGNDLEETEAALAAAKAPVAKALYAIYAVFLRVQRAAAGGKGSEPARDPDAYRSRLAPVVRGWAWLGPSTHVAVMSVFACAGALPAYVWMRLTLGNALMALLWIEQTRRERRI
jgi:phosphatidylglycerophosphate synthase